jgi:ADP-ribose pyrophosphatase YjhB (NUDIX family)
VVLKSTQVLLVRDHSTQEAWDLPGGFLRLAEPPPEGLKRELLEELNADVSVTRLLEVQIDPYGTHGDYSLNLYYEVNLVSETLVPSDEIAEYGWFSLTNLPRLKYPGTAAVLSHMATSVDGN